MLPRKDLFDLPEGVIYLDGNSLGVLPKSVKARVAETISAEWGRELIRGWNKCGWMDLPNKVGDRIAALIGAGGMGFVVTEALENTETGRGILAGIGIALLAMMIDRVVQKANTTRH